LRQGKFVTAAGISDGAALPADVRRGVAHAKLKTGRGPLLMGLIKFIIYLVGTSMGMAATLDVLKQYRGVDTRSILLSFGSEFGGFLIDAQQAYSAAIHSAVRELGTGLHLSELTPVSVASYWPLLLNSVALFVALLSFMSLVLWFRRR
jgi:hypothetical protein